MRRFEDEDDYEEESERPAGCRATSAGESQLPGH